jgi:hypothetical protein
MLNFLLVKLVNIIIGNIKYNSLEKGVYLEGMSPVKNPGKRTGCKVVTPEI